MGRKSREKKNRVQNESTDISLAPPPPNNKDKAIYIAALILISTAATFWFFTKDSKSKSLTKVNSPTKNTEMEDSNEAILQDTIGNIILSEIWKKMDLIQLNLCSAYGINKEIDINDASDALNKIISRVKNEILNEEKKKTNVEKINQIRIKAKNILTDYYREKNIPGMKNHTTVSIYDLFLSDFNDAAMISPAFVLLVYSIGLDLNYPLKLFRYKGYPLIVWGKESMSLNHINVQVVNQKIGKTLNKSGLFAYFLEHRAIRLYQNNKRSEAQLAMAYAAMVYPEGYFRNSSILIEDIDLENKYQTMEFLKWHSSLKKFNHEPFYIDGVIH